MIKPIRRRQQSTSAFRRAEFTLKDTKAVLVCVDFADILKLTLPYNREMLQSVMVVTHPRDEETVRVASEFGADVIMTTVFYEHGALFNKFAALELGLDRIGRSGWIAVMDVDILLPRRPIIGGFRKIPGKLYTPRRRMLKQVPKTAGEIPDERKWRRYRHHLTNEEFAGYCQIFHADDPVLGPAPWHMTNWKWCAGADTFFQKKWSEQNKVRPPFEVLHLGEPETNWAGRVVPFSDGTVPEDADMRRSACRSFFDDRRKREIHFDRYEKEKIDADLHPDQV